MRIVHLSDIHLSEDNYIEFKNNYREALIKDLSDYHRIKPIDLIVITGDLVDKGGFSLFKINGFEEYTDPYEIFKKIFIDPISQKLGISLCNFLFVPGNHDIDEREILLYEESQLSKNITSKNINSYLNDNLTFKHSYRIKKFKTFEEEYHRENPNYNYSPNQSTYYFEKDGFKIGFILANDSWRCTSIKLKIDNGKHYFGVQQLHDGLDDLNSKETDLNICLLHHYISDFEDCEEITGFLQRKNIEVFLYGHFHNTQTNVLYAPPGNCLGFRGRAALFKPEEVHSEYHSGYQILDFDLRTYKIIEVHYRKYNHKPNSKQFISDNETASTDGIDRNISNQNNGFMLHRANRKTQPISFDINQFRS